MVAALRRVGKVQVQAGTAVTQLPVWDMELGKAAGWFLVVPVWHWDPPRAKAPASDCARGTLSGCGDSA